MSRHDQRDVTGPDGGPTPSTDDVAALLLRDIDVLARTTSNRHLDRYPAMRERYGTLADVRCAEDTHHHLEHLAAAVTTDPALFTEYVKWAADMLAGLGIDADDATAPSGEPESYLHPTSTAGRLARDFLSLVLAGDRSSGVQCVVGAADAGLPIERIHLEVFQPVMREVGRLWQLNRATVAQEHLVTAATQVAMAQLYPRVFATPRNGHTAVVLGVGGELHELGSRMLADIFELHGWTTRYLGANTPTRSLVRMVTEEPADVIAISATIGAHVPAVTDAVEALRAATDATILVGGRPFLSHARLWQQVGADGSAADARSAVELATDLLRAA